MIKKLVTIMILSLFVVLSYANCNTMSLVRTINLMGLRAGVMKDVAAYKWYYAPNHKASAYSAQQEIKVLNEVNNLGKKLDLDPISLMVFSQIQMDISKQIEAYWIAYWNNPNTPNKSKPSKANLKTLANLRQHIESLDAKLFPLIKLGIPNNHQCSIKQLRPLFIVSFKKVSGLPTKPNFINMLIEAFRQIK